MGWFTPDVSFKSLKVRGLGSRGYIGDSANKSVWGTDWVPVQCVPPQSIIRVVFHDRRLQYTEHQQLEGWRWNRPGDRILDLGEFHSACT